jgi:hypothetical protein
MTMKKGILHVELVDRPRARCSNAENNVDGGRFNNWIEGLIIVDAVLLRETLDNLASLVSSKRTISIILVLENPLASDDVGTRWTRNQPSGVVINKSLKFLRHSSTPLRIS